MIAVTACQNNVRINEVGRIRLLYRVNRVGGGKKAHSLDRTPVFLEMILATKEMWSLQVNRSFRTTPRNFVE